MTKKLKVGDKWTDEIGNEYVITEIHGNIVKSETVDKAVEDDLED